MSKIVLHPMSNEEYHAHEALSASGLNLLKESVIHFKEKQLFGFDSAQFVLGSLVHKMVLEPETLDEEYIKEDFEGANLNKNSKAYKEAKANFIEQCEGLIVIPVDLWDKAERMCKNVMEITEYLGRGGLFHGGIAEDNIFSSEVVEVTSDDGEVVKITIDKKCRADCYRPDLKLVIDLKTTRDGEEFAFSKSIEKFGYHMQAPWNIDMHNECGRPATRFINVTVDSTAPHMVRVYEVDAETLEAGRAEYRSYLEDLARYKAFGEINIIKKIGLPEWRKNKEY